VKGSKLLPLSTEDIKNRPFNFFYILITARVFCHLPSSEDHMTFKDKASEFTQIIAACSVAGLGLAIGGPIVTSVMLGIGTNLVSPIIQRGASLLKEQWLTSSNGILNHDIQRALQRAYVKALKHLKKQYFKLYGIPESIDSLNSIQTLFDDLIEAGEELFLPSLEKAIATETLPGYLSDKSEGTANSLWYDLKAEWLLETYDNHLKNFLRNHLVAEVKSRFAEELKNDSEESNKAWRAFQRMLLEGIQKEVEAVTAGQEEIQKDLKKLETMQQQLGKHVESIDECKILESFQHALKNSLGLLQQEIRDSMQRIDESVGHIDKTTLRTEEKADALKDDVKNLRADVRNLSLRLSLISGVGAETAEMVMGEDFSEDTPHSTDEFINALAEYSKNLPDSMRCQLFRQILEKAWHSIAYQYLHASRIYADATIKNGDIAPFISPICKMCLNIPVTGAEAKTVLTFECSLIQSERNELDLLHRQLSVRFIRFLLYEQSDAVQSDEMVGLFEELAAGSDPFWVKFFVDVYYRHVCHFLQVHHRVLPIFASVSQKYATESPRTPLVHLWPFIVAPLVAQRGRDFQTVIDTIKSIAKDCEDVIEMRWCLSALMRMLPLYALSEDELDYSEVIDSLIEEFPRDLVMRSSQLLSVYLNVLLRAFLRTKKLHYLAKYESNFIAKRTILPLPTLIHLQLEYASALFVAMQFLKIEDMVHLRFYNAAASRASLVNNVLFANPLIRPVGLPEQVAVANRGTLFRWLIAYTHGLCSAYVKDSITINHLRILQLKATVRVSANRLLLSGAILSSLKRFITAATSPGYSFCAKSTDVFETIPRNQHIDLMIQYVELALKAEPYEIIIHGKGIAKCLYWCFFYGSVANRDQIKQWAVQLADVAAIGKGIPKQHWAYYAGIMFQNLPMEKVFVAELTSELQQITRKIYQLKLRRDEEVNVKFSSRAIDIVTYYTSQGSLFAMVLKNDLSSPEIWNILATTIFNYKGPVDCESLERAGLCYSLAKCFARGRMVHDHKYCYNYIRCKALELLLSQTVVGDFFVKDIGYYLEKNDSAQFSHKINCVEPFFEVIKRDWSHMAEDARDCIVSCISRVDWLKRNTRPGKQLAGFGLFLKSVR